MYPAPRQHMKRSFGDSPPHPISLRVSLQIPSPTRSRIARLQGRSPSQRARIMSTPYPPHPRNWPSASGGRAGQCPRYGRLRKGTVRYGKIFLRSRCQMNPESQNSNPDCATFPVATLCARIMSIPYPPHSAALRFRYEQPSETRGVHRFPSRITHHV